MINIHYETSAELMAYGYARAKLAPTVVTATEGPGVTNLATGIAAAYKGNVPVISIIRGTRQPTTARPKVRLSRRSPWP